MDLQYLNYWLITFFNFLFGQFELSQIVHVKKQNLIEFRDTITIFYLFGKLQSESQTQRWQILPDY